MKKESLLVLVLCIFSGWVMAQKITALSVEEKGLTVHDSASFKGIPVYQQTTVDYKRKGVTLFQIQFKQPVVVAVASQPEKWGYFQFPGIVRTGDGAIHVKWSMQADAMESYGMSNAGAARSADDGKTWQIEQKDEAISSILLTNGDRLKIETPRPYDVKNLKLPKPIDSAGDSYQTRRSPFYRLRDLPDSCRNIFFKRLKKGETQWKTEQAVLNDPDAARNTARGKFPIVWWGDMKIAADGSLIAGIYPGHLINKNGSLEKKDWIFFYRSTDNGRSWNVQGRIPYQPDLSADPKGDKRSGLLEPAFEILKDGTFLCISRTTDGTGNAPMYASYSTDQGKTWSRTQAIAPFGVLPRLLQLDNGVTVLSSGRPGVQLRFSLDAKNSQWCDPFEMLPYENMKDQVSCGYTGVIPLGINRFMLVYSDFEYKTAEGDIRKAIKVREVIVNVK